MTKISSQELQSLELLKDVPLEQLQWLIDKSDMLLLREGDFLFGPDNEVKDTFIIMKGRIKLSMLQNGEQVELYIFEPGMITGLLPYSRGWSKFTYGQALTESSILKLSSFHFTEMVNRHFELTQAMVHVMANRVKDFTAITQQNEKMMALGKLSAGLAHELNNPAAAIMRSAKSLKDELSLLREKFRVLAGAGLKGSEIDFLAQKLNGFIEDRLPPPSVLKERRKSEEVITEWLDGYQIEDPDDISEVFVDFGLEVKALQKVTDEFGSDSVGNIIGYMGQMLICEKIASDLQEGASRISGLVGSVKNFTHMDQAKDKEFSDIHEGIRNTLTMLNHKVKQLDVRIVENFDLTIPPVKAMIGKLNQVWTNLIDNALDAMENSAHRELEIKSSRELEFVCVWIIDSGPGIPSDIVSSVFDPFFTTKPIGKGTGLGLDVVIQIIRQHKGTVKVSSVPGRTEFKVCFPING